MRLNPLLLPGVPEALLLPVQLASKTHSLISPHERLRGPSFYSEGPENSCLPTGTFSEILGSVKVSGL